MNHKTLIRLLENLKRISVKKEKWSERRKRNEERKMHVGTIGCLNGADIIWEQSKTILDTDE